MTQDSWACDEAQPGGPPAKGGGEAGHHWVGRPTGPADPGRVLFMPKLRAKISRVVPTAVEVELVPRKLPKAVEQEHLPKEDSLEVLHSPRHLPL
jgi:hypothetical protein